MFENREAAARELARRLRKYEGRSPLILAIPRGAVPMGRILADALGGDLDVVLVHKLGAPQSSEYAIGAVDEGGRIDVREVGVDAAYIEREAARQLARLRERRARYSAEAPPLDPAGRTVIVVDDGVATGATLLAALRSVRAQGPAKLIAAVAVAPRDTARRLRSEADEVVILDTPAAFFAVGQFFQDFEQVTDEQVIEELRRQPAKEERTT